MAALALLHTAAAPPLVPVTQLPPLLKAESDPDVGVVHHVQP